MGSSRVSRTSATKRCAVAAAGLGMVLASFAGAAASANAATYPRPAHARITPHIAPHIVTPVAALGATSATPVEIPAATLAGGTSVALPTITITDPGILTSGQTVTLSLFSDASQVSLDTTATPTVTPTGASTAAVTVTGGSVSFTVTKTNTSDTATYVVSGVKLVGETNATSGSFGMNVTTSGIPPEPSVATFDLGAVTHLLPAAYGATSVDTAATVFDSAYDNGTNNTAVLASDYEPQDAESANYLASALTEGSSHTGILLTDPTTLSSATSTTLAAHSHIDTIFIVGGTSVVSAAVQTQLEDDNYNVVRLAGPDQYATNQFVVNYVAQQIDPTPNPVSIDYTQTQFNDTSGASSPTTTDQTPVKTAIVASGSSDSFQDGIVSGPLSYSGGFPVILTTPTSLSSTALALLTEGGYKQVILLGGPAAVSNSVEAQLTASTNSGGAGVTVFRIAGQDASDTSTKLASFLLTDAPFDPVDDGVFDGGVLITRGTGFQDALAAGPYAGNEGDTPILLTENATVLGAPLTAYLKTLGENCIYAAQAVGGPLSVAPAVQTAAIDAEFSGLTGCVSTNQVASTTVATAPVLNTVTYSSPGYANLAFDAPSSDGGSAITGYQYSVDDGATWSSTVTVSGSSPYTVTIPITLSDNYVRVRAVNGVGNGPESNQVYYSSS